MDGYILSSNNEAFLYERAKSILSRSTGLEIHPAIALIELVTAHDKSMFTQEEWNFLMSSSRVDVAITKGYGKRKVTFVLESDSGFHDTTEQRRRDALKDIILKKSCIPLMRFRPNLHYRPNRFDETFIDTVLTNISRQEYVRALGLLAWLDAENATDDHPVFLTLPFEKEFEDLIRQVKEAADSGNVALEFLEDWTWEDEQNDVCYNRHLLLGNKKLLTASTGKCSEQEFKYGAYAAAERFAKMGCLYKYLINTSVIGPERRPFLNFLSDEMNRTPPELLNPPPW